MRSQGITYGLMRATARWVMLINKLSYIGSNVNLFLMLLPNSELQLCTPLDELLVDFYCWKEKMMDTLNVRGLPDEYTIWLQKMVDSLREQTQHRQARKDKEIVFATHKSHPIGGYD